MLQPPRLAFFVVRSGNAGHGSPLPLLSPSTQPYEYESESPTTRTSWGPEVGGGGGGGVAGAHGAHNAKGEDNPTTAGHLAALGGGARTKTPRPYSRRARRSPAA